jgi:hypothetical protein
MTILVREDATMSAFKNVSSRYWTALQGRQWCFSTSPHHGLSNSNYLNYYHLSHLWTLLLLVWSIWHNGITIVLSEAEREPHSSHLAVSYYPLKHRSLNVFVEKSCRLTMAVKISIHGKRPSLPGTFASHWLSRQDVVILLCLLQSEIVQSALNCLRYLDPSLKASYLSVSQSRIHIVSQSLSFTNILTLCSSGCQCCGNHYLLDLCPSSL